MKATTLIFLLVLLGLVIFGALAYFAASGYGFAYVLLGMFGATVLISIGLVYNLIANKINADSQQRAFLDNAKENLSIMSALQSIQNKQNSTLLQQLGHVQRLPEPKPNGGILIEDGVFDELEG
jgi:hypothetical protein